jgi:hypothetical protein
MIKKAIFLLVLVAATGLVSEARADSDVLINHGDLVDLSFGG